MIFNVLIETINVASMLHRYIFNEQTCFFLDADIHDSPMFAMCSRMGKPNLFYKIRRKIYLGASVK